MTKVITLSELVANIRCRRNGKTFLANFVNQCEFRDAVIIPPNVTNGDMLKGMFPNMNVQERNNVTLDIKGQTIEFTGMALKEWWNAPYKGSEG